MSSEAAKSECLSILKSNLQACWLVPQQTNSHTFWERGSRRQCFSEKEESIEQDCLKWGNTNLRHLLLGRCPTILHLFSWLSHQAGWNPAPDAGLLWIAQALTSHSSKDERTAVCTSGQLSPALTMSEPRRGHLTQTIYCWENNI